MRFYAGPPKIIDWAGEFQRRVYSLRMVPAPLKPVYVVETTMQTITGAAFGYKPYIERKVYRWRWRARLNAWLTNNAPASFFGIFSARVVEEWPADNVVSIRRAA